MAAEEQKKVEGEESGRRGGERGESGRGKARMSKRKWRRRKKREKRRQEGELVVELERCGKVRGGSCKGVLTVF